MGKKNHRSNFRPNVPEVMKRRLVAQAGNKCANPGCSNRLIELHHIREWHTYETHDEQHMIALCPACHQAVHRGSLRINDSTVRRWKTIARVPNNSGHLYVEPGEVCEMVLGTIRMVSKGGDNGLILFQLSSKNRLAFKVVDGRIFLVHLSISDVYGRELVKVDNNYVQCIPLPPMFCESRQGKYRITTPATSDFVPDWVIQYYARDNPKAPLAQNDRFTLLDIEVIDRGIVQVQGIWVEDNRAIVATEDQFSVCTSSLRGFVHFSTAPSNGPKDFAKLSVWEYKGPIEFSLFSTLWPGQF